MLQGKWVGGYPSETTISFYEVIIMATERKKTPITKKTILKDLASETDLFDLTSMDRTNKENNRVALAMTVVLRQHDLMSEVFKKLS